VNTSIKPEVHLYPATVLKEQILSILLAWGMSESDAKVTADVMVETDLRGVDSHGINMLRQYEETKQRGALNISPNTEIVRERKTTALLDADRGLGHPVSVKAMEMAIAKAKIFDIGTVCVRNSHHFGAAGHYAELAAAKGMIGVVTTSTRGISMVPTHGRQPVLGTNPFAFSTPAGKYPPLVLDFATTVAAVNKVKVHNLKEISLPIGWVNDANGTSITIPKDALKIFENRDNGGLNPIGGIGTTLGGHKGYGLALFSHVLSGVMPGASFSPVRVKNAATETPDDLGHFFQAINPESFRPIEDFNKDIELVIDTLKKVPPANPNEPVLLPGEPEQISKAKRLKSGIPINDNLQTIIKDIAKKAGVDCLL
tara:strand:+ start:1616 stop:2725 length:1110 start_codon:yes stop_codon:yes gene_type:complete